MSDVNLLEVFNKLTAKIDECDEQLDSLQDPATSGKTKLINGLVAEAKEGAGLVVTNISERLANVDLSKQVGMYYAIVKTMDEVFGPTAKAHLEELMKSAPKVEPMISEEEAKEVLKKRNELAASVKALITMATAFDPEHGADGMFEPKKRSGKTGKRGPRALSGYDWEVNGKKYASLKEVQADYSQYYEKVANITAAMRGDKPAVNEDGSPKLGKDNKQLVEKGSKENNPNYIDTSDPEDTFSFTLPNGDILIATKKDDGLDEEPEDETPEAA